MPGYLGPGSAAHHPRVALRAPEGKLVPGPRCRADPGMLRCARDDSRDTCDAYAIALPSSGRGRASYSPVSDIELVAGRHPAIACAGSLDEAECREGQVIAHDRELLRRHHVEHPLAGRDRGVVVVVERGLPLRLLDREDVVIGHVAPDQEALAPALNVIGHMAR